MVVSAAKIANRWVVRDACRSICEAPKFCARQASLPGLTSEALEAFAAFWEPPKGRVAFGGIVRRLKQLADGFRKAPLLWAKFKKSLGVEDLTDIPKAIMVLAKAGKAALGKIFNSLFNTWPLKIYTLEKSKVFSISTILDRLMKAHPNIIRWLDSKVKPKVDQFDRWLRESAPTVSKVVLVAVYFFIWFNVIEFEWDLHSLIQIFSGNITLADLPVNLPNAGIGALVRTFGFGMFSLFPVALVARLFWLLSHRYITWTGHGFEFDWGLLSNDLGISRVELEAAVQ